MPYRSGLLASLLACTIPLGLAACGADDEPVTETQVKTVTEVTTVTAEEPDTTIETITEPEMTSEARVAFQTPTGNIGCQLTAQSVRCDIREIAYTPPPKPATCDLDFGNSISLGTSGPASFTCYGDTAIDPSSMVLAYGDSLNRGPIVCESSEEGITCGVAETGQGFNLSRQAATLSPSS